LHADFTADHPDARTAVRAGLARLPPAKVAALAHAWRTGLAELPKPRLASARLWLAEDLGTAWYPRHWAEVANLFPPVPPTG
jgi:hypothetical protein